jgi:SM-20-related protein
MPKADFFQRLGLFADEHFLDAAFCRELRSAIHAGRRQAATVAIQEQEFVVDRDHRRVNWVSLDDAMVSLVHDRLIETRPAIEAHYGVALTGCQRPQFLAYSTGDYYTAHRDHGASNLSKVRQVSAVIFLNEESEAIAPDRYGGGALTFYDLFDSPTGALPGIPLDANEGLLITFPSEMLHAVTPVTHGERYTIASWYF